MNYLVNEAADEPKVSSLQDGRVMMVIEAPPDSRLAHWENAFSKHPKNSHTSHKSICVEARAIYTRFRCLSPFLAVPDPQSAIYRETAAVSATRRVASFLLDHTVFSSRYKEAAICERRQNVGGGTGSSRAITVVRRKEAPESCGEASQYVP